jgi:ABC-type antimicrobial peptide transport system permease subunit
MQPRFNMALLGAFAALGLALAAVGIYSVISYDVAQRGHELSIRVALGAKRADILTLVLRKAANVTIVGVAIGICGSFAVERIVRFKVFAESYDTISMVSIVTILFVVALLAAWWPARRAGEVRPISALRHEA